LPLIFDLADFGITTIPPFIVMIALTALVIESAAFPNATVYMLEKFSMFRLSLPTVILVGVRKFGKMFSGIDASRPDSRICNASFFFGDVARSMKF